MTAEPSRAGGSLRAGVPACLSQYVSLTAALFSRCANSPTVPSDRNPGIAGRAQAMAEGSCAVASSRVRPIDASPWARVDHLQMRRWAKTATVTYV